MGRNVRLRVYGTFPGVVGATGYDLLPSTANADGWAQYAYGQSILSRSWVLENLHLWYRAPMGDLAPGAWNGPMQFTLDLRDGLPPMWVAANPAYPTRIDRPVMKSWKGDLILTPTTAIVQTVTVDPSVETPWWAVDFVELGADGAVLPPVVTRETCG